jgi:multidrug efflux pump subunit AcrB
MVDIDPDALRARGLTPNDIVNAVNAQSLTLPSGDAKMGDQQFIVRVNASEPTIAALNQVPVKQEGSTTTLLSDVAHVRDGWPVQQNIVRDGGKRSVLLTIIKNGDASTLDVVNRVKAALPEIQAAAPAGMQIKMLFDQSVFVKNSIDGVLREGAIAAGLTALMILIFLGSWRSTLVVMVSIPLSILASVAVLSALGQTINTMTLGGLALAVGILVDDSTVTIENTHRLLEKRDDFDKAVLEGAAGIAVPTLISTLAICCVFISVFFIQGAARYLFTPLAMAVVFAMLASYALSRTLTPIMISLLLRGEHHHSGAAPGLMARLHAKFNTGFDRFRDFYGWLLAGILSHRRVTPAIALLLVVGAGSLAAFVGRDFFPPVDAGLIQLHVRAPARTRIERTEQIFQAVEDNIRKQIPAGSLRFIVDDIGLPQLSQNLAYSDGSTIGVNDGVIQIQLAEGHPPTAALIKQLRAELPAAFPDVTFYFQPADLVTQVLNFGIPTQIDVQVQGRDRENNKRIAALLQEQLAEVPGIVDTHVQQELDAPEMAYAIDRTRAQQLGLTMQTIANQLNTSLSSDQQIAPNFWTDVKNGIPYYLTVQTPEYRIASKDQLDNTPVGSRTTTTGTPVAEVLGNIATAHRVGVQSVYSQSNIQPVYDVYGSLQGRDLGSTAGAIQTIASGLSKQLKPGNHIVIRGQIESMNAAFTSLTIGLIFAAVFVYLLMVINYQSFLDPLAVVLALPGTGAGILLMLFVTGTTLSVPSLMGSIMAVGVASANSILLVTFAREQLEAGMSAFQAALFAGTTRLRPVLMTAAAMVVGMLPMAIGGPGEEQNAVLARAVIGGVLVGTMTTLLVVPYLYSTIGRRATRATAQPHVPATLGAQQ